MHDLGQQCCFDPRRYMTGLILFLTVINVLHCKDSLSTNDHGEHNKEEVVVRAVFLNCDTNEESAYPGNEDTRFQREELFKHNALQECQKKLALTLKICSEPEVQFLGEEYVPIEHVFDGPNKKRVRLLDPYILRMRRESPLQAYKLRLIDTVSGFVSKSDFQRLDKEPRTQRDIKEDNDVNEYQSIQKVEALGDDVKNTLGYSVRADVCSPNSPEWNRDKRHEHNIIVEGTIDDDRVPWFSKDRGIRKHLHQAGTRFSNDNYEKEPTEINSGFAKNRRIIETEYQLTPSNNQYNPTAQKVDIEIVNTTTNNIKQFHSQNDLKSADNSEHSAVNHDETREQTFSVFEIGKPDLWYTVRVQLFEKMTSKEGNTVWNDLTKGNVASVSSSDPEWVNNDLNIKYRPTEWISENQFSLPVTTTWCLLVPLHDEIHKKIKGGVKILEDYIVLPKDDIVSIGHGNAPIKRDENGTAFTSEPNRQGSRRVSIRISRALFGNEDEMKISSLGPDRFLTMPYRRLHRAQIDLEARADDNELIRVGCSGSIITVVADSTRPSRSVITIQATNKGLAAARFRIKTRDCGPELSNLIENSDDSLSSAPVLVPPRHTHRFRLEMPVEIPLDVAKCSVAMVNEDEETVAVREVSISKGDRCFCVWHCDCVCLNEDPKLLCREMSESRQSAAGLSVRRSRRARSACYCDVISINLFVLIIGVLMFLLALGVVKAVFGLFCRCIAEVGLSRIIQTPRKLEGYYESCLKNKPVIYDDEGWPVHPDTKQRTVSLISRRMEFVLNVCFFIMLPSIIIWDTIKQVLNRKNQPAKCSKEPYDDIKSCSAQDLQKWRRRRSRRRRTPRKWMTPHAEKLSTDLWSKDMTSREPAECEFMRPLLHESNYRTGDVTSSADSEQDDTEYVLTQMKKSKDSLIRSQRKMNEQSPKNQINPENANIINNLGMFVERQ